MRITGKCSWFGGPNDDGVAPDEGLAFIDSVKDAPSLFLPAQPAGTTGLARRLNPNTYYIACRWDYNIYPKPSLLEHYAMVRAVKTNRRVLARPADWGPNANTNRVADLSPACLDELGITTDDEVEVTYPWKEDTVVGIRSVVISAGHGSRVPGAEGLEFDEEDETPVIMEMIAAELRKRSVAVTTFVDRTSTNVSDNLAAIVDFHNSQPPHDLDISCHFNASDGAGHGTEVLYVTQEALSARVSAAIASNGFTDRGAVYRDDLAFLNGTKAPAVLLETCFLDNRDDVDVYQLKKYDIAASVAEALTGGVQPVPPDTETRIVKVALTVPDNVTLVLTVNGEPLLTD
jgi:N-acetylmuramoyl-L-alanine amidase